MNTETTPITMTTPLGPLYLAVMCADRYSYHSMDRGNVTDLRPMVRVATDSTFDADPTHADHWTIRGRAYAVHYEIFFEDRTKIEYANGYQGERWHRERTPYAGGFRKDNGGHVPFGTATWDVMWKTLSDALDTFDANTPGWQDLSRYLLLRGDQHTEEHKAAELRREAAEHDTNALNHGIEAARWADKVPPGLMLLARPIGD